MNLAVITFCLIQRYIMRKKDRLIQNDEVPGCSVIGRLTATATAKQIFKLFNNIVKECAKISGSFGVSTKATRTIKGRRVVQVLIQESATEAILSLFGKGLAKIELCPGLSESMDTAIKTVNSKKIRRFKSSGFVEL
jgi:hypothetical protein